MDYRKTLHLPETDFPMRAALPAREPQRVERWRQLKLYARLRAARAGGERFTLHDGPPYANGNVHVGTALNKILKDAVVKFENLTGRDAPFVPGWDTHGLPIEMQALAGEGLDAASVDPVQLRSRCRAFALANVDRMRAQFERLGVLADWDHPYITLDPRYEAEELRVLAEMVERDLVYRGLKPVHWCPTCRTALAEAELEYEEDPAPSVDVLFPVVGPSPLPPGTRLVAWTTTPWTLPANEAVAVHPELSYRVLAAPGGPILVAEAAAGRMAQALGVKLEDRLDDVVGRELEGLQVAHPLDAARRVPVVLGEHVSAEEGTGLVHTAPGHGAEDFEVGVAYDLPVTVAVDGEGRMTAAAGPFAGMGFLEANGAVLARLEAEGRLLRSATLTHSYPHCWRCHGPTLQRATVQWFIRVGDLKEALEAAVDQVTWVPGWGRERMRAMTRNRTDWCISRQRAWGLMIPAVRCRSCDEVLATAPFIRHVADVVEREGSAGWWAQGAEPFLPADLRCPVCGARDFQALYDTLDVWFDSGVSHRAAAATNPEARPPIDLYSEGDDQFRGWFQSSLITAVATTARAPYRTVHCHGFVVDGEGRKMSKSQGNALTAERMLEDHGADIMRLWVAASDYPSDVRLSEGILAQVKDAYRKVRNTWRFLLGNLHDFDPATMSVDPARWPAPERYIAMRAREALREARRAYEAWQYPGVVTRLQNLGAGDLSAVYLNLRKDALYCNRAGDPVRRAAQTVMYRIARALAVAWSPILSFTADEVYEALPGERLASVHLERWPEPDLLPAPAAGEARRFEALMRVRDEVLVALERERAQGRIHDSLEARVEVGAEPASLEAEALEAFESDLATFFIVSEAVRDARPGVRVSRARGLKCARCWMYLPSVGQDPEHPAICARCADVVRATGAGGAQ